MTTIPENSKDLLLSSYRYDLPQELIASRPLSIRHQSKLLVYRRSSGKIEDCLFQDLPELLESGDHLVMNNSKVIPCRLKGKRPTGGEVEVFVLGLEQKGPGIYKCLVRSNSKKRAGDQLHLPGMVVTIEQLGEEGTFWINFGHASEEMVAYLANNASIPIPPYIRQGVADEQDQRDYQTIYAQHNGSVAAPTAGLHFTPELLGRLQNGGIGRSEVTLHVGLGTFTPIKEEYIQNHQMHWEYFDVTSHTVETLNQKKGHLIAVGTTSLRVLESIWNSTQQQFVLPLGSRPYATNIFLHPGKEVASIKGMITNFHLPESSLLVLVSTLVGREKALELYRYAISHKYRFFSYGDAMLVLP